MALYLFVSGAESAGGGAEDCVSAAEEGAEIPCRAFIKFKSANFSVILSSKYQIFVKIEPKFIA